jgi:hypothetical protein
VANNLYSHTEGYVTKTTGEGAHAEGYKTTAVGLAAHAEGGNIGIKGTELEDTMYYCEQDFITVQGSQAYGSESHAEGIQTLAYGHASHAEGYATIAMGLGSHAEGNRPMAIGQTSHAEGSGVFYELVLNPTDEENTYILINKNKDNDVYIFERDLKYDWI